MVIPLHKKPVSGGTKSESSGFNSGELLPWILVRKPGSSSRKSWMTGLPRLKEISVRVRYGAVTMTGVKTKVGK